MANITRIKAKDSSKSEKKPAKTTPPAKKAPKVVKEEPKKSNKKNKNKAPKEKKELKNVFWLARPFVAIGRYVSESWHEIRQVRWPNGKATWKMVLAVFVYTAIFIVVIMLLDALFSLIFNSILGK